MGATTFRTQGNCSVGVGLGKEKKYGCHSILMYCHLWRRFLEQFDLNRARVVRNFGR